MTSTMRPPLREIMTGRPRPRHLRFAAALAELAPGTVLERRDRSLAQRLRTNAMTLATGVRTVALSEDAVPVVLHQALARTQQAHIVEYDVPLAVHGYSYAAYLRHADRARRLMEAPSLRAILVFSEWAKRSFALHFGEAVGAKCRVSYPLAAASARFGGAVRDYDFTFISTQFRLKGGPELVRAFAAVRGLGAPSAHMCVVTNLAEAGRLMGDLARCEGIDWREANCGEADIADLLARTHCLVHPSLGDSFGVVVLEALAAGCALLTTSLSSFPELATEGSGITIEAPVAQVVGDYAIPWLTPKDLVRFLANASLRRFERDLAEAMSRFATDAAFRATCQAKARDLYLKRFSRQAWLQRMKADLSAAFGDLGRT